MNDHELKNILLKDQAPPVRVGLVERIVSAVAPTWQSSETVLNSRGLLVKTSGWRYQWMLLALLAIIVLALAQPIWFKQLSHADEDLNSIDTLSLSSLMTL